MCVSDDGGECVEGECDDVYGIGSCDEYYCVVIVVVFV